MAKYFESYDCFPEVAEVGEAPLCQHVVHFFRVNSFSYSIASYVEEYVFWHTTVL